MKTLKLWQLTWFPPGQRPGQARTPGPQSLEGLAGMQPWPWEPVQRPTLHSEQFIQTQPNRKLGFSDSF